MDVDLVRDGDIMRFGVTIDADVACLEGPKEPADMGTDRFPPRPAYLLHRRLLHRALADARQLWHPHGLQQNPCVWGTCGRGGGIHGQDATRRGHCNFGPTLVYGSDTHNLSTDLCKELVERGFKGLIYMPSGSNSDHGQA